MTKFIKIKLIKGSFTTDSDFSKFDYNTVLTALPDSWGADVLVHVLEAAGARIDLSGDDITCQDAKPVFYFSAGTVPGSFNKEYEVVSDE